MQKEPVGEIYRQMVKTFAEQQNGTDSGILKLISTTNDIEELEMIGKMRGTISSMITGLTWRLKENNSSLPAGYFDHVIYGRDIGSCKLSNLSDEAYGDVVFYACEAIHDGIVKNSRKLFFSNELKGNVARFLPLSLAGTDELKRCYEILTPVIQDLELGLRWGALERFYPSRTKNFLKFSGITNGSELVASIRQGDVFYYAFPHSVSEAIKEDGALAEKLALSALHAGIKLQNP